MVKFGEMATHISKRVEPSETDLAIYVGLEHLDPDSLRIKRHGKPGDFFRIKVTKETQRKDLINLCAFRVSVVN